MPNNEHVLHRLNGMFNAYIIDYTKLSTRQCFSTGKSSAEAERERTWLHFSGTSIYERQRPRNIICYHHTIDVCVDIHNDDSDAMNQNDVERHPADRPPGQVDLNMIKL